MVEIIYNIDHYGIKNFSYLEVTQKYVKIPVSLRTNIFPTLLMLQKIRDRLGIPVIIHSVYRNPQHNKAVGGKPGSLHLMFNAIDFCPAGFTTRQLTELYNDIAGGRYNVRIYWNGAFHDVTQKCLGAGLYNTFIHLDTRGLLGRSAPAVWNGIKGQAS